MTSLLLALALAAGASNETGSWVLVRDSRTTSMHGDLDDLQVAKTHLRELGPEQDLVDTQRELSKAQQALGREQQKMGREQQKLGDQQRELSRKVERRVDELITASLRDGTARPVAD